MNHPSFADLKTVATIARYRSFSRAAAELGVSRSALSHSVRQIEADLGIRLFHRSTRSVALTDAGNTLLAQVSPLLAGLERIFDDLAQAQELPTGMLRINAPAIVVRLLLEDVAPTFLARYRTMQLDLAADGRFVDIVAEGYDAGIRLAGTVPQDMIAVPFGEQARFLPVAAPAYLARHGVPSNPHALAEHVCIGQRLPGGAAYKWEFEHQGQALSVDIQGELTLNDTMLLVDAALAGMGIAYVPELAVRTHLAQGTLQALLAPWCPVFDGLCLYYPGNRLVPIGLRKFIDVLLEKLPPARRRGMTSPGS